MKAVDVLALSKGMKLSDHVYLGEHKGVPAIRQTKDTAQTRGIYFLIINDEIIYAGISATKTQSARSGFKQRMLAHGEKITGMFLTAKDTQRFRAYRNENLANGKDLIEVLNSVEMRFISMPSASYEEIDNRETEIVSQLVREGHCRLNGAKRG